VVGISLFVNKGQTMRRSLFVFVFPLLGACATSAPLPPLLPPSTSVQDKRSCADLTGRYSFEGKWARPPALIENGQARPWTRSETAPRIDEHAFSFVVHTITEPQTAVVQMDVRTGKVTIDILGSGSDSRFALMSAKLPFSLSLACTGGHWQTSGTTESSDGGIGTVLTTSRRSVQRGPDGSLIATGDKTIDSGLLTRSRLTQSWQAEFKEIKSQ
jgi:hypothetical protein